MAVHKKKSAAGETLTDKEEKPVETKSEEVKVTETTETIEVIEDVVPQTAESGTPAESPATTDPLSDFKEKMVKEELSVSDNAQKKNYMWPILFIFIVAIILLTGVFLYRQGANVGNKINVTKLSPTPTITPEPTKAIDLAQYEIEILNGSGVDGEASRQKLSLTSEGFTVSSVGNADNSDYTDTVIKAKKEVNKDFLNKLKTVLESSFTVKEEELEADSSVPVIIIIGTKI